MDDLIAKHRAQALEAEQVDVFQLPAARFDEHSKNNEETVSLKTGNGLKNELAQKFDGDKLRYDLLPPEFLEGTADILTFGAGKYGERNWEKGMSWSRPFGALMRHMWAWWRGENFDPETGKSHLWHASCCIAFLMAYEQRRVGIDDRPKSDNREY